jgi:hypothetical protein
LGKIDKIREIRGQIPMNTANYLGAKSQLDILFRWCGARGGGGVHFRAVLILLAVHILFTLASLPPCQRLEIRNRDQDRQGKI